LTDVYVGHAPGAVAVDAGTNEVYVGNFFANSVTVVSGILSTPQTYRYYRKVTSVDTQIKRGIKV